VGEKDKNPNPLRLFSLDWYLSQQVFQDFLFES
jgi:hypothetical protein